jgi:hypothetical protein
LKEENLPKIRCSRSGDSATDKKFLGHDGREYVIGRRGQKSETKNVLEMTVEMESGNKALAKYALLLIDIS